MLKSTTSAIALACALFGAGAASAQSIEGDGQWNLAMIGWEAASQRGYTGQGVLVGVYDSGVMADHPDLVDNLSDISFDVATGGPVLDDPHGHGTHVTGIIAAARNGVGVQGVAYDATVAVFRLPPQGEDYASWDQGLGAGVQAALDRGVTIINNSWGWDYYLEGGMTRAQVLNGLPAQIAAFRAVAEADGIMVFSTGNEKQLQPNLQSGMPYYVPELKEHWLAVTAVGPSGLLADYANHCGLAAEWCLTAPGGEYIENVSPLTDQIVSTYPVVEYQFSAGTSMAAPHVTGAVAIAKQMFPNAPAAGLTRLVLATATDIGAAGVDDVYGWGLLNLENMVSVLDAEAGSVFANGAWAADEGQTALIETLSGRLASGQGAGAWAAVLGARADHDPSPDAYGASSETYGLVGGFDVAATDTTRIGVALSASRTDFDEDGIDNGGRVDDLTLAGYAAARKGVLFGEASAGFGYRDYSYDRRDILGASGTVLEAQGVEGRSTSDGWAAFADARFGAVITAGTAELRPFIHGRLMHQSIDAFDEAGADVFSQRVGKTELERYEYGPGVQGVLDAGGGLRAELSVRYDFRSGDDDYAVPVTLMGSAVPARIGPMSDGVTVNGGVEARLGEAWQASARGYWAGGDDRAAGGVSLGLSYTF